MSYKRLNEIVKSHKNSLNKLYKDMQNPIITKALNIAKLDDNDSSRLAIVSRIVDLRFQGVQNELKKLGKSKDEIRQIEAKLYDYVGQFHIDKFSKLIQEIKNQNILSEFDTALVKSVHNIGIALSDMQKVWQAHIVQKMGDEFESKFKSVSDAIKFIDENELYQKDGQNKCDRAYGAVIKDENGYKMVPYIVAFKSECEAVVSEFKNSINLLKSLAKSDQDMAYIAYFTALELAFSEHQNDKVVKRWQDAERAWMECKGALQVGHPLEYYEDAYTHAVALEWDLRLCGDESLDADKLKDDIKKSFVTIYEKVGIKNEPMRALVSSNIDKTQLYICSPMLFYGAEFNGLFSAQVVPNDEVVSSECGKKIFAFVDYVYESSKAKPFMKLASEIFDKEFLDYGRDILFNKPQIWKKVYEISTIGHEFGHILFIDSNSENLMNSSGEFKYIEEYKATTGGLVSFFLNGDSSYDMAVFAELIKRSVGLIAWKKVAETRAYYCEGLIHLTLLFRAGVLKFDGKKLFLKFDKDSFLSFKNLTMQNYIELATHYSQKLDAGEFLARFAKFEFDSYMPLDDEVASFVEYYHQRYEAIGNEIDDSGEWEKWQI